MSTRPANRDTVEGFLRDLSVRLTRLERQPPGGRGAAESRQVKEVWIGNTEPDDTNVELWYDPSATLP